MRSIPVRVVWRAVWQEHTWIEVPDDADEVDVQRALELKISEKDPRRPRSHEVHVEEASWERDDLPEKMDEPEEGHWISIPGHGQWITDGYHMIREGRSIPPRRLNLRWKASSDVSLAKLLPMFERSSWSGSPPEGYGLPSKESLRSKWSGPRAERTELVLAGLSVRYTERLAVGLDDNGDPAAFAALWRRDE